MDPTYLNAKRSVDDRSLNRHVWDALVDAVRGRTTRRVMEIGAGTGSALHRALDWGLWDLAAAVVPDSYLCVDTDAACKQGLLAAADRLHLETGARARVLIDDAALLPAAAADVVIAHAVMDLFDPVAGAELITRHLVPGGIAYTPITYAMPTVWYPTPPELTAVDAVVTAAYDRSMYEDGHNGQATALLAHWPRHQLRCLSAGASDWVVLPGQHRRFLEAVLQFVATSVRVDGIGEWLAFRRSQLDAGVLGLVAHNLDMVWQRAS